MSLSRFPHGYSSSPIHPQNPCGRYGGDREENPQHTADFPSDENSKNGQKRMKVETLAHHALVKVRIVKSVETIRRSSNAMVVLAVVEACERSEGEILKFPVSKEGF
jgi:hypothetical protein